MHRYFHDSPEAYFESPAHVVGTLGLHLIGRNIMLLRNKQRFMCPSNVIIMRYIMARKHPIATPR